MAIFPLRPSLTQKILLSRKRTFVGGLADPDTGPNPHPQGLALLVQEGFTTWRGQPLRFEHRRAAREQACTMQRPRTVEDPCPIEPPSVGGVKAVALDEEEIERPRLGLPQLVSDPPGGLELGRRTATVGAPRRKADNPIVSLEEHAGPEV